MDNKEFRRIMNGMMEKGWRAYHVEDWVDIRSKIDYMENFCDVEVVRYDAFRMIFVRDYYKRDRHG